MSSPHPVFGFPTERKYRFRISGGQYRVGSSGIRLLGLLRQIVLLSSKNGRPTWAIRCRNEINEIQRIGHVALLSHVVEKSEDQNLRRLAIWLRGRCGGAIGTDIIGAWRDHEKRQIRKEVARALLRMKAWHLARSMLENETCPRIRNLLLQSSRPTFGKRLNEIVRRGNRKPFRLRRNWLFVDSGVDLEYSNPPKSLDYVRELLLRIRRLLSERST